MNNPAIFSQTFDIQSHHIDANFEITLPYLLGCMQQTADMHVDSRQLGWKQLNEKNCFWAIYRMGLQITRMPRKYDTITVKTWANPPQNLIQPRSFEILDATGETIIRAQSLWVILENNTFKLLKVADVIGSEVPELLGGQQSFEIPLKIGRIMTEGTIPAATRTVLFSDIDVNQHVNNTNYAKWLIDSYPIDFLQQHRLTELILNYTQQARLGERYHVFINNAKESEHLAAIQDADTGAEICKLKANWVIR